MTEEDNLLKALAGTARERAPGDEPWEKLARGELDAAEVDALSSDLSPEDAETMRALYTPLDPLVKKRIARGLTPSKRRWIAPSVAALAIAALVLLFAWPRGALPEYTLELSEGAATQRGDHAAHGIYRADDRVTILLRPETGVDVPVEVEVLDGDTRWSGPIEVAPTGAVRITGRAGELFTLGTHELTIIVRSGEHSQRAAFEVEIR